MRQKIDCFITCNRTEDAEKTVAQLRDNKTVHHIFLLSKERGETKDECHLLNVENVTSTQTMMRIAENAAADYVLFCTKAVPIQLGPSALERMLQVASDSGAAMVYSDRLVERKLSEEPSTLHAQRSTLHPQPLLYTRRTAC